MLDQYKSTHKRKRKGKKKVQMAEQNQIPSAQVGMKVVTPKVSSASAATLHAIVKEHQ